MAAFPTTRHSVIERLRDERSSSRREAFGDLVGGYWKPVYKYLRVRWRLSAEEAEDATQALFAEAFEHGWFERYDSAQARFRTFVRVCADRLVMNRQQAGRRGKRGGAHVTVGVDFDAAERELSAEAIGVPPEADEFFKREFVRALFDRAVRAVREDCVARGRQRHWTLFERYDLAGEGRTSYAALAAEFGLTAGQVTGLLAQTRGVFRTQVVAALEAICASREEFRREARELLGLDIE